ncbi:hypothetical protein SacmaDRAFT_3865 [Saccharomonospora marina XMU15]|uniref:Uncharacterized protein n=1 Tax=Saccharomonospora marina XMU15 TaxID=882083 RepID=H5X1Z7_9PSEU|nr:hypothetical protein [Saccharomonospora marina]EHR52068.1 hypothetical protein SacmaDRAFT_3865 [Saccharomonospora marina XMU15]
MRTAKVRALVAVVALLFAAGCTSDTAQDHERARQQSGYDRLTSAQPAEQMGYSPTRETINYWIKTWDEPQKLSYVYLLAGNGQLVGYYVFTGLPVSYCASLTPTYRWEGGGSQSEPVPAPAMDGVYYSGQGSCETYYGRDATTGSYLEYTVGTGISALVYEEPLPRADVEPLGFTKVEDVK